MHDAPLPGRLDAGGRVLVENVQLTRSLPQTPQKAKGQTRIRNRRKIESFLHPPSLPIVKLTSLSKL